jgi:hypothetical protein
MPLDSAAIAEQITIYPAADFAMPYCKMSRPELILKENV